MNARWYNSGVGRFMSEDTYFGTMMNPQSQNQYSYVMNNSVNMYDPSGNVPSWVGDNTHIVYNMNSEFGVKLPSHTYSLVDTNTHNSSWYLKDEVKTSKEITYYYESKRTKEWIYRHSYNYTWRESPSGNSYTSIDWDTETVTFRDKDYYYKTVVDTAENRATKNKIEIQKLAVSSLQNELNNVLGKNLKKDGQYGTNTGNTIKDFQKVYNLPKTGVFDVKTFLQLEEAFREYKVEEFKYNQLIEYEENMYSKPSVDDVSMQFLTANDWVSSKENENFYNIVKNKFNLNVQNTQDFLISLGYNIRDSGSDGKWGSDTKLAVNKFQSNKTRRHAGIDYNQSEGTVIKSIVDGTIIDVSSFYKGTYEIAVKSYDGYIIRYAELKPNKSIEIGQAIHQGQTLGTIKHIKFESGSITNMLHLELFSGELGYDLEKNKLSIDFTSRIENMIYFQNDNYNRRKDLLDPTWSKYLR